MERYYSRMMEAKTLEELKTVYADMKQAFCSDWITFEEYSYLRQVFHRRMWGLPVDNNYCAI